MYDVHRETSFEFEKLLTIFHSSPERTFSWFEVSTVFKKSRFMESFQQTTRSVPRNLIDIVARSTCTRNELFIQFYVIHHSNRLCKCATQIRGQTFHPCFGFNIPAFHATRQKTIIPQLRQNFRFSSVFPISQQQCFGIQGTKHVIRG